MQNKTRHPVPDYLKDVLVEKNQDRGLKFTLSNLMNDQMLLDNNLLKKNKGPIERKKGLTINWHCITNNCYFRATTVDDDVERENGSHNHDPNKEEFVKREGRVKLKEAVTLSDAPLASVVLNVIAATDNDAYLTAHGSNEAMKQCARRFKQSQFPDLGKQQAIKDLVIDPLWFEIRPNSQESLLLFDNGFGRETEVEGCRLLVFGSKLHLNLLLRSLDWMGDGTFDVSPYIGKEKFYQLYTIAGFVRKTPFTLLRVLMQKKDARSYKELFNFLLKTALDNGWQFKMVEDGGTFIRDFEWAPHLAKNLVLSQTPKMPGSQVVKSAGCNFHFASGILKDNNVKQCMKILYDKNDEHREDVRLLLMLVYVPEDDIPRIYDLVSGKLKEKESQAIKLLPRLTKYYVHGYERPSDKSQILPRFPPTMWSCMSRVLADKPCTTNFLEGSHRGYDFKFMKNHPSIYLIKCLINCDLFLFKVSRISARV